MENTMLRVSAKSYSTAVAGAIAGIMREAGGTNGKVELQAIGAAAVNQAIKAVAIARTFLAADGLDLLLVPAFRDVTIEGEEKTAIRFFVEARPYVPEVAPQAAWGRELNDGEFDGSRRLQNMARG